jgi:hypothetical protein
MGSYRDKRTEVRTFVKKTFSKTLYFLFICSLFNDVFSVTRIIIWKHDNLYRHIFNFSQPTCPILLWFWVMIFPVFSFVKLRYGLGRAMAQVVSCGFASVSVHVGFVVKDKVALEQAFLRVLGFTLSISFHPVSPDTIRVMIIRPIGGSSSQTQSHSIDMNKTNMRLHWEVQRLACYPRPL